MDCGSFKLKKIDDTTLSDIGSKHQLKPTSPIITGPRNGNQLVLGQDIDKAFQSFRQHAETSLSMQNQEKGRTVSQDREKENNKDSSTPRRSVVFGRQKQSQFTRNVEEAQYTLTVITQNSMQEQSKYEQTM